METARSNLRLARRACAIRRSGLLMGEVRGAGVYRAGAGGGGGIGGVLLSGAERPRGDPDWEGRGRVLLSIGHCAIALYIAMVKAGIPESVPRALEIPDEGKPVE